jgi:zona occludens toxin
MIELITGLPGNAKTLYAISMVRAKAEQENRPVYYSGIKALTLPGWTEIDPLKWMQCPQGALILIDECQKIFRARSLGSTPPVHVTELEEHRHRGHDLFLLSQHPSLVDPSVRRLSGVHRHLVRIFGMEASTVHRWPSVKDNCDKNSARVDSEKTRWGFDKSLYGCYHSADEHTMKRHIPLRLKLLVLVPVVLALAGYSVYRLMVRIPAGSRPVPSGSVVGAGQLASADPLNRRQVAFDPVADAKQFVAMNMPRVAGLPHTAPKYDVLTVPTRVPVPAACIQVGGVTSTNCKCYSQQGTVMAVEFNMCIMFARNGFFEDFDPERDRRDTDRVARSSAVLDGRGLQQSVAAVVSLPEPSTAFRIAGTSLAK